MKKWRKWQRKGGRWQVRLLGVDGELKELKCPGAYHLHKKYARLVVEAAKTGGHTQVAEKMPKGH